jgi:hypothetical protein
MIGALGDVVFVVSADTIRTFEDLSRSTASRWAKHEIIGRKPKLEYIGPDTDTISFKMRFDVAYGMNPRKEMEALLELARSGKAVPLVIGGKGLGVNKWVVKSVTQNWVHVDNRGNVLVGVAEVTLEEYV